MYINNVILRNRQIKCDNKQFKEIYFYKVNLIQSILIVYLLHYKITFIPSSSIDRPLS